MDTVMVPFNTQSFPDNSICENGTSFSINEAFMLISSIPIAQNSKVYFEFTINSYNPIVETHNIPIYAGVSKEVSFGVLNSDFCIGSLFFKDGSDFNIMEKCNATNTSLSSTPPNIYTRVPGATDIIGVGVDWGNNLIILYNNGQPFYSFSPSSFNMSEETDNFYFCIWGNTACNLQGTVNFGKTGVNYLPSGFTSLYGYYNRQQLTSFDVCGSVETTQLDGLGTTINNINGSVSVLNSIVGTGIPILISNSGPSIANGLSYNIPYQSSANYLNDGASVFCDLPIPTNQKIYLELIAQDGTATNQVIGIPLSVGISNSPTTILSKSMRMPLFHYQWNNFTYSEVLSLGQTTHQIESVDTSIPPVEGQVIGLVIDLANNSVTIYVNDVELYTFQAQELYFDDPNTPTYVFIHDEGAFTNSINGTFNFGATPFIETVPEGCISLYDYYNHYYPNPIAMNLNGSVIVLPYFSLKSVYLLGNVTVLAIPDPNEALFPDPGLNKLMGTFNMISNTEPNITMNLNLTSLNQSIANANNGYFPD